MTPLLSPPAGWLQVPPIRGVVGCWRYHTPAGWVDIRFRPFGIEVVSGPGGAGRLFTEDPVAAMQVAHGHALAACWVAEQHRPARDVDQLPLFEEATR